MRFAVLALTLVAFASFVGPAGAVIVVPTVGFWTGVVDGFLCLFKLLLSPFVEVTVVAAPLENWTYTLGYCIGLLSFTGMAGALGYAEGSEASDIRWG